MENTTVFIFLINEALSYCRMFIFKIRNCEERVILSIKADIENVNKRKFDNAKENKTEETVFIPVSKSKILESGADSESETGSE